jgi:NADPH:quinone reductase-like Zn-dependent oxidoreductase
MSPTAVSSSTIVAPVVTELGTPPTLREVAAPEPGPGQAVVRTHAATVNTMDVAMASGRFPFPMPTPYVPGLEGCGVVAESSGLPRGTRVRFSAPFPPGQGCLAPLCVAPEEELVPVPDDAADDLVAGLGHTTWPGWYALTHHARLTAGESVLILGATGPVGRATVQLAKHLGAGRVVGTGRDEAALGDLRALGADAAVRIAGQPVEQLSREFMDAAGGPVNIIVDGLWGPPALAAIGAAGFGARFVNLGESAAWSVDFAVSALRFKGMTLLTHGNPLIPAPSRAEAFGLLLDLVRAGTLRIDREVFPLPRFSDAWAAAAERPRHKIVVDFSGAYGQ